MKTENWWDMLETDFQFMMLRKWRNQIADERSVPRYRVRADYELRTIAETSYDVTEAAWRLLIKTTPTREAGPWCPQCGERYVDCYCTDI